MTLDVWLMIGILATTFALLIFTKLPPASVFLGALTMTITFRLAPLEASLKGFSNPGVLTIGALFMVAAGMYSTGAITMISEKLIGRPKTLITAQARILPPVAFGSAFLNNTPLVAMMIPVVRDLAKSCRLPATRLYIPLSYSSILGGTCTLIGTATNLVVAGMVLDTLKRGGDNLPQMREIAMFDLAWVGVPITVAGILFIMLTSRWLLPDSREVETDRSVRRLFGAEFRVQGGSSLVGRRLADTGLLDSPDFELTALTDQFEKEKTTAPETVLEASDVLRFSTVSDGLPYLWRFDGLVPNLQSGRLGEDRFRHTLVEAAVSRRSSFIGRELGTVDPESPYKANLIAASRGGRPLPGQMRGTVVQAGDIVVAEVDSAFFYENRNETEFSMTRRITEEHIQRRDKAAGATLITVAMVVVVSMGWMSMLNAALLASGLLILSGCLPLKRAGASIDFSTLVVIASAIGIESAVSATGLSSIIAKGLGAIGGDNPMIALIAIFVGCIIMDTLITNVASAAFMYPIALVLASSLGVSFMPFAVTLMVGASCSFISPMGYQTNLMVYGPGKYGFIDYVKVGVPLTVLVGVITVILTPIVFPF
jgi:di/tricarboxylate transporter